MRITGLLCAIAMLISFIVALTKIAGLRGSIADCQDANQEKMLRDQLDELSTRYWPIKNMKTWPVDIKTRKRFSINNIILLLPILYNSLLKTFNNDELFKALSKIQF